MTSRPELQAPPEIFYNDEEARCGSGLSGETLTEQGHQWIGLYVSGSMLNIALQREVEGELLLGDMGQVGLRSLKLTPILLVLGSFALVLTMMGRYWYFRARREDAFSSD